MKFGQAHFLSGFARLKKFFKGLVIICDYSLAAITQIYMKASFVMQPRMAFFAS